MSNTTTESFRNGRQVEVVDTTPVKGHERFQAVTNNRRFYDGQMTDSFFWGIEGVNFVKITGAEYIEAILNKEQA